MFIDMRTGMCLDMRTVMCIDNQACMHTAICIDVRVDMPKRLLARLLRLRGSIVHQCRAHAHGGVEELVARHVEDTFCRQIFWKIF